MELKPEPIKTTWSLTDYVVLVLFLIPPAMVLFIRDQFARLRRRR